AGEQPGFAENLEAVADAEHAPASRGVARDRPHDGREARDGAAAQIVAVREAPRQDHAVDALQVRILVPEHHAVVAEHMVGHPQHVAIVVRPGKRHHAPAHHPAPSTISSRKSSITPFASSCSHMAWTRLVAAARSTSRSRSSTYLPTRTSPTSGNPS